MLIDFVLNISLTISGIYLFHRLQYTEDRRLIDSGIFQALLMTTLAVLLLMVPIHVSGITFSLYFIPLLILVKYSVPYYMLGALAVVYLFHHLIFGYGWQVYLIFAVLYIFVMAILPFLKFEKLRILTGACIIFSILYGLGIDLFINDLSLWQMSVFVATSTTVMFFAMMMYEDINDILKLLKRYEEDEYKDYLTQLGNIKAFDEEVNMLIDESETLSLLLIDIDNFKVVNDEHSYKSGDALIKQMANLLDNHVPNGGSLFRNSGEEFAMVIPNLSFDKTVRLGEAIRNSVERANFHISDEKTIHLTVSIGVGYRAEADVTKGRMFTNADDMLHAAKKQGQNRVMFIPFLD